MWNPSGTRQCSPGGEGSPSAKRQDVWYITSNGKRKRKRSKLMKGCGSIRPSSKRGNKHGCCRVVLKPSSSDFQELHGPLAAGRHRNGFLQRLPVETLVRWILGHASSK